MNVFHEIKAHTKFPKGRIKKTIEKKDMRFFISFFFFSRPVELIKWMEFSDPSFIKRLHAFCLMKSRVPTLVLLLVSTKVNYLWGEGGKVICNPTISMYFYIFSRKIHFENVFAKISIFKFSTISKVGNTDVCKKKIKSE